MSDIQRDTAKEVALMTLCAVQREYGAKLHPNLAKDVQIAIDGLRSSMGIPDLKATCERLKANLGKFRDALIALKRISDNK